MREDQVENGFNFLVHPKAKSAPLSQRINFLENKGLTPEEISAALSRVESGNDGKSSGTAGGDTATSPSILTSMPTFPVEPVVPLWRQLAVPGTIAVGAVGALGAYYASQRSAAVAEPSQNFDSGRATSVVGRLSNGDRASTTPAGAAGYPDAGTHGPRGMGAPREDGGAYGGEVAYAQDRSDPPQRREAGSVQSPFERANGNDGSFPRTSDGAPGPGVDVERSSLLAGEFRRLTQTMEQQTGHLVEAVGAMKALASRAEEDSSSLLAARVSSHTSELRAELATIKQLLLLQDRGEAGAASSGVRNNGRVAAGAGVADDSGGSLNSVASTKTPSGKGKDEKQEAFDQQAKGPGASDGLPTETEIGKAKEAAARATAEAAAASGRRKETARAALATLLSQNAPQAAKDGIAMLRMLVANLINQPNVPRYRRITVSNNNFKKRLLPLEGHRAMMEAVGFKPKGNTWEWAWHEESGPSASSNNKAVLEDVVKAIDAVARPNGAPLSSAASSAPAPIAAAPTPASSPSVAASAGTNSVIASPTIVKNGGPATSSGANGANGTVQQQHQQQQSRFSDTATTMNAAAEDVVGGGGVKYPSADVGVVGKHFGAGTSAPPSAAAAAAAAAGRRVDDVGGSTRQEPLLSEGFQGSGGESAVAAAAVVAATPAPGPQAAGGSGEGQQNHGMEGVVVEQGTTSASMAEVAAAIQRGEEPPGIRVIEDRLSADAPSLEVSTQASPPKPWEMLEGAGAAGIRPSIHQDFDGGGSGAGVVGESDNGGGTAYHAISVGP